MIFYFSGQIPLNRKPWPKDKDMKFFLKEGDSYDRLICVVYEKDANLIIANIQEATDGNGKSKGTGTGS